MTLYDSLPVYKTSYELLIQTFEAVKDFKKEYKYTLGEKIKQEILDLIIGIYKANSSVQKQAFLQQTRASVEVIRLLFRLSKDMKLLDLKTFVDINLLIESISKQLSAREKYSK